MTARHHTHSRERAVNRASPFLRVKQNLPSSRSGRNVEIDVGIVALVLLPAVADLQIDDIARRAVDEMVAVVARPPGNSAHAPAVSSLHAGIGDQCDLALEDIDELVLMGVPVALGRGGARRQLAPD